MPPEPPAKRACAGGPAGAGAGAVDRLSALPDGLLHVVLSFLPAPHVVRTCVLSRRWRDLWRSAPYINIDDREFGITLGYGRGITEEKWGKFEDFTTNLLLFRDSTSSLDKFRLYAHGHNERHVDRWIRRGIKYCPAVLDILIYNLRYKLPPLGSSFFLNGCVFTICLWIAVSQSSSFPAALSWKIWSSRFARIILKTLHHPR